MIGRNIIRLTETTSTNSYAANLLKTEKPSDGTIIFTESQTEGKGQPGNKWESERGKNLAISIILYPHFIKPEKQFQLNKFASLAVLDFIKSFTMAEVSVKIKWPNDIYADDKKIAGILIENSISGNQFENVIVGIGININQEKFSSGIPNPVSLKMITGKEYNIESCLKKICISLQKRFDQLSENSDNSLDTEYLVNNYRYDIFSKFRNNNSVFSAKILGITKFGKLQLEDAGGDHSEYTFKEIEYII